MKNPVLYIITLAYLLYGTANAFSENLHYNTEQFKNYWYSGSAEITSYKLEQARYGEIHDGYAVLIFVTEDFSNSKHVKLDNPHSNKDDAVKILKLNLVKKFNTGIYRYSIMGSIFTPVMYDIHPDTLKLTFSSQEWCGHTFTQINLAPNAKNYNVQLLSYFESEGDREYSVEKTILEDEIFTKIRLNPKKLPVGNIKLIPSLVFARLKHQEIKPVQAKASLVKSSEGEIKYSINYNNGERQLEVFFNDKFPYNINSWKESYKSGFGAGAKRIVTTATMNKSIKLDYWNKNTPLDEVLRLKLDIE